jgi:hypothetical protein
MDKTSSVGTYWNILMHMGKVMMVKSSNTTYEMAGRAQFPDARYRRGLK